MSRDVTDIRPKRYARADIFEEAGCDEAQRALLMQHVSAFDLPLSRASPEDMPPSIPQLLRDRAMYFNEK